MVQGHNVVTSVVGEDLCSTTFFDAFDGELTPPFPFVVFTTFGMSLVVVEVVTPWAISIIVLR
jgi:hypothetical protein